MERVKGIEPSSQPWEGHILPLNHTRRRGTGRFGATKPVMLAWFYQTRAPVATGLLRSRGGFKLANGGAQFLFNRQPPRR
jgi:hypothetical protein